MSTSNECRDTVAHHLTDPGLVCSSTIHGDHCYPQHSCAPQRCNSEAEKNTLSPDILKEKTSKAKILVKKDVHHVQA